MRQALYIAISVFLFMGLQSCYKDNVIYNAEPNRVLELPLILEINNKKCFFDGESNTLRYSIEEDSIFDFTPYIEIQEYSKVYFNGVLLQNHSANSLGAIKINEEYTIRVITNNTEKDLKLSFTNLPIVQIITEYQVLDEPKVPARFIINYPKGDEKSFTSYIGLEYRGATSQQYDKKSFGFSFLNSLNTNDKISKSVFNLKENTNWILDAMYIDRARLRNKVSFEIWMNMELAEHPGIHSEFVELYINNEHRGIYCLNENMNAELLDLRDDAVLYKAIEWGDGATRFETYSETVSDNFYWDGWEQKFPDPKLKIDWSSLDHLRDIVVNKSNSEFVAQIYSEIDLDSFLDYYLFLNLVLAMDNTGKNTFLAKANQEERFIIIPWDIDGAWGLFWDGSHIDHKSILSNHLYDRLLELNPQSFTTILKYRWQYLRNYSLSNDAILDIYKANFKILKKSGIQEIENDKWNLDIDFNDEQIYLEQWILKRLDYLDLYYEEL